MAKKLILSDGTAFYGEGFGSDNKVIAELVFNTSMTGYQEIITDNSYAKQMVVMTFPLIGNYGINDYDNESIKPYLSALIVKEHSSSPARDTKLEEYLKEHNIPGICNIDTRKLTRYIRDNGSQLACIVDITSDTEEIIKELQTTKYATTHVKEVSIQKPFRMENTGHKVVVIDYGIKTNILRELQNRKCDITIVPYNTTYEEIKCLKPDAVFLSNGPGDPNDLLAEIEVIKKLQEVYPIFGICLGHQLIAIANNCEVVKMKFGHRGANHPVKNLITNKIEITSQNHSYQVNSDKLGNNVEITHINLTDNTVEGIKIKDKNVFSVQYHPESAPGPVDSLYLFDEFMKNIMGAK